jgi:transposase-like zinc-binding protein
MKAHRPELADVFRTHQSEFLARWNPVLSRQQRRALRDIRDCRTAVLGGHLQQCDRCGHRVILYNSCLMGSNSLWGVGRQKGMLHVAARPFDSPLSLALQQREQFVRRPELALAKARRHDRLDGLQLFGRISANVDFRRGQITVP